MFKLTSPSVAIPAWSFAAVSSFDGTGAPALPGLGGVVVDAAGVVYGTSQNGGVNGYGTAYGITP